MRADLLALTPDDLAAMANRGLVKRAQRELEADLSVEWDVGDDGTLTAQWSDAVNVTLPGSGTARQGRCSCGAFELCRHVLRTVLAWQARNTHAVDALPDGPWDPGEIADEELANQCAKGVWERAEKLWDAGVLAELLRTAKPSARFHSPGHTVRFPVPRDARYAQCSCSEAAPCVHAVLGVRAFRQLAADETAGLVSAGPLDAPVPVGVLETARASLDDLFVDGLASGSPAWRDRARRTAGECERAGLLWPAQLLEELAADFDLYHAGDAAFQPFAVVQRVGELLLRLDAIGAGRAPVPQAFIRGMRTDRDSELGSSRLIGLGAIVRQDRQSSMLSVVLQDSASGNVLTLEKSFAETDPAVPRKDFHLLGNASAAKEADLTQLARGQIVMQGGKRTAAGRLVIGRARSAVSPQNFAWERLVPPVLVEDFGELDARLRLLPPAPFRPRRAAADFHVCPLQAVSDAHFDPHRNAVVARLRDNAAGDAWLVHPWSERGRGGAESLLRMLQSPGRPLFVSGWMRRRGGELTVQPAALVWERDGVRQAVLPWLERPISGADAARGERPAGWGAGSAVYAAAADLTAELLLQGARRLGAGGWVGWARVEGELESSGLHRAACLVREVRCVTPPTPAAQALCKLLALAEAVQ